MTLIENSAAAEAAKSFTFGVTDYIVFVIMLLTSAGIGVYFGFFSKSKNTTDEYLMGSKQMKTIPIAISLVASQLSGIAIMSVPAETYTFGFSYFFMVVAMILVVPTLNYIIIPVFYKNNISNCYEYLQMRFDKRTRKLITASFVFNAFLMLPVYIFVPALAFSQVTGINIHLINAIVCSICIFYTMLGGIKAVVWTDVVQAGIMVTSVVLVGILGTIKVGGLGKVFELAEEGGRLDFYYGLDPRVRNSVISLFTGGILLWTGHIGLNQSCVQRIVSLPSMENARRALILTGVGVIIIMGFNAFSGIVMFARYSGCDPIKAGLVQKPDKMMPFFVQDIMGHLKGMPGVFISCVFSAALSTMSANLNSLAGVVYFDYIKPFIRHTDARANAIMKIFVVAMGSYCILGGLIVQKFNSILQTIVTITSLSYGAVIGVFLVGMFVPRVNGKCVFSGIGVSLAVMLWIIVNAQMRFKSGEMKYEMLPTTLDQCEDYSFHGLIKSFNVTEPPPPLEKPLVTTAFESNRPFSIFEVSFYWYKLMGLVLLVFTSVALSYVWKREDDEKYDPKLYSPVIWRFLPKSPKEMESVPLKAPHPAENGNAATTTILLPDGHEDPPINGNLKQ
ncbi:sodium-coupled monocarboxylate transporter 2 [Musca vetustissima]|uniref:sodium-coupled monocarboxylate transporter 2 n=1 Tax=Musca vetustissima TaxID=27455 RepID=UPI002AB79605|nr:sodium-coupled monocarboxylate transporter 2 [Musca vetustissima]